MSRMVFNPALVPVDQRAGQFVVRGRELETITTALRRSHAASNQHILVIGARGFGKSTLMHRVVAELHRDPKLGAAWFALVFPEESYEVGDEGELWLEAVHRLAITTREPHWERQYEALRKEKDTKRLSEQARQALRAFAEQRGCRLLLVIENLDSLLGDQLSDRDAWALRKVLQDDPTFMLLATAVRRFPGVEQHDKAFYEAFRRIELSALEPDEISTLWTSITRQPMPLRRAQAVRVLTGGNPRLIQILAGFWRSASVQSLFDDLTGMVDQHTDYFRGNIEAISGQQRRVFLALAALWRPATAGDVARQARIDSNPASVELGRLVTSGRVEVVSQRGRVKRYQVAERLYNIYYLMRQGGGVDARVRALADFMVGYYDADAMREALGFVWQGAQRGEVSPEDCADLLTTMLDHGGASEDVRALLVKEAPAEYLAGVDPKVKRKAFRDPAAALLALRRGDAAMHAGDVGRALAKAPILEDWDDVAAALAPFAGGDTKIAMAMIARLLVRNPWRVLELIRSGDLTGKALTLAIPVGAWSVLRKGDPGLIRAWRDAALATASVDDAILVSAACLNCWLDPDTAERVQFPEIGDAARAEMAWTLFNRVVLLGSKAQARRLIQTATDADGDKPWVTAFRVVGAMMGRWEDEPARMKLNELARTNPIAKVLAGVSAALAGDLAIANHLSGDVSVPLPFRLWFAWKSGESDAVQVLAARNAAALDGSGWAILSSAAPHSVAEVWRSLSPPTRSSQALAFAPAACTLPSCRAEVLDAAEIGQAQGDRPMLRVACAVAQAVAGRMDGALQELVALLGRPDAGGAGRSVLIDLCLALAACGVARDVADAISKSPHRDEFVPLLLAIDSTLPEDEAAAEELQVARDLRERLRELEASEDRWASFRPQPPKFMVPPPMSFVEGSGTRRRRR